MAEYDRGELTIEDILSISRVERASGKLTAVRPDLYTAMIALVNKISAEYDRQAMTDPDSMICEGLAERKKTALQTIRRILEFRISKVAQMAILGAMGGNNAIDNLPPEEREYYYSVLEASKTLKTAINPKRKKVVIPNIVPDTTCPKAPARSVPVSEPEPEIKTVAETAKEEKSLSEIPYVPDEPRAPAENAVEDDTSDMFVPAEEPVQDAPIEEMLEEPIDPLAPEETEQKIIRILEDIPVFSGPNRDYKLRKGDVIKMPSVMAQALLNRNMATSIFN